MSNLRNSVRLAGFLGSEPEAKSIGSSKKVVRVSIATHDSYKNEKGERVEETQWHNLVLWDKQASLAEKFLHKGSEVAIEGKLTSRSYTDKEGTKRYITEVVVHEVLLMDKKAITD
ncbi:single-stranded DNA-binding protein [Hufsiella ginkgonis]|uniref:Single-stranded DNA-binding protein n=1 Tax=Hufsiella ginkgonis TaxID=2695274 RepID=A0A7K1XYU3_9SPHI|nr:single-stranded DNA-binding protein [Hufsiella ginkgonis]MXV16161.1 single-stranded DNA-binding protein [Hufsiella ginkgonis]